MQVVLLAHAVLDLARAAVCERGDEVVLLSSPAQRPQLLSHGA